MKFAVSASPHIRSGDNTRRIMLDVLIALVPTLIAGTVVFGLRALAVCAVSVVAAVAAEWLWRKITRQYGTISDLSAAVTGLLLALTLPASVPYWAAAVGAVFAVVVVKGFFGGLGQNIFNPAAVGMILTRLSFSNTMSYPAIPWGEGTMVDVVTGGTVLSGTIQGGYSSLMDVSLLDLFLGRTQGAMGEVCKVLILVGLLYLLLRQAIDWRVTFTYIGAFTALIAIAGIAIAGGGIVKDFDIWHFIGVEFLAGGMLFGATFMLTDPVTMPATKPGRYIYALSAASLTVLIRLFASAPEGVGYSILLANLITPVLDHHKVASSRWTWKKWLTIGLILLADILFIVIGIIFGGKVK